MARKKSEPEPYKRDRRFHMALTLSELVAIMDEADATGLSQAELVRRRVFQGKWRRPPAIEV